MKLTRTDTSRLAQWWFTVDHVLLSAFLALIAIGVVLSLAASPAVAMKKGFATYYFVERHVLFAALSSIILVAVSFLTPKGVRRLALILTALALVAMGVVILTGQEINGARRWLSILGYSFQPSELAKPGFIVMMAWLFCEAADRKDVPALPLALVLWGTFAALLVMQPDVGQTVLVSATAGTIYLLAGLPLIGAFAMIAAGAAGLWFAYQNFSHVQMRIDGFLRTLPFENFQGDRALQSFSEGGFFGRGPGEGTIKSVLPDAHTDYIFAVVAEEYGVIACLVLLGIFAFIVLRALSRAGSQSDGPIRLAIQGLAILFGLQALINMAVNVGLLPPKGMTLPFISAGGSSMLALAVTAGMLLALTRRRPDIQRLKKPRLMPTISRAEFEGTTGQR
ncbi:MAG TPA: putative peptidoglycan glycosyltransferase FtsW [Hyphomicrobium sp.]|nr:putative peptidoglycan glycosyltransferase FtsW [Hyphomicrobium sp.]